jgi:2-dehydropantoate 2-reductase
MVQERKMAIVGIGATGTVLAAALLGAYPETVLVGRKTALDEEFGNGGITVSGAISLQTQVKHFCTRIDQLADFKPDIIFLATKTFHLRQILADLKAVFQPGNKIVATQNGLGVEELVADTFGSDAALRMNLNYGVALKRPGNAEVAFFNRPNHIGCVAEENRAVGTQIAQTLSACGLDTEFVDDIKLFVWKKMIMKCTMASICAVTNKTIKDALEYKPTREIADACFKEALAVAKAMGYDLGEGYLKQAMGYLEKAGVHRDSMCYDIEKKAPTEIDFLGAKIVEYARRKGIATPFYIAMTNLVKAIESNYLG